MSPPYVILISAIFLSLPVKSCKSCPNDHYWPKANVRHQAIYLPFAMVSGYSGHNSQTPIASLSSLLLLLLLLLWFLTIFLLSSLTPINRSYCRLKPLSIQRKVETDIRLDRRAYLLYTFCIFIFCLAGLSTDRQPASQPGQPCTYADINFNRNSASGSKKTIKKLFWIMNHFWL